jgi:hypothetical protein
MSSLCIFALLTISLTICTSTVEAKLQSVRKRNLGQVDAPKEGRQLEDLDFLDKDPSFTLALCQGDCDEDDDCEGDLVCFQRDGDKPVPGCSGSDGSRSDYCIDPNAQTTPSSVSVPLAPVPAEPVSASSFRLKLYWEDGVYWQEEEKERKWCMQCRSNCRAGKKLFLDTCSNKSEYFDFRYVQSDKVLIKLSNQKLCLERDNKDIYLEACNRNKQSQLWSSRRGSFDGDYFEITPDNRPNLCITQRHHPKAGEEVELETCVGARRSDTSKWNRY